MAETVRVPVDEVLRRAGEFFLKQSPVHAAALRLADTLREMEIPYAIAGAMAANAHGHVRTTEDVDVLLTRDGLARFKAAWLGRGWVERFPGSKGLTDVVERVKIDVLLAGEYPGDGRPKPVVFPDPASLDATDPDGVRVLPLRTLMELKIASGMTAPHRPRDLDDAIQLIRINHLPREWPIDAWVLAKYGELWELAQIDDEE